LAQVDPTFDVLLQLAKSGDAVALGHLLDSYRAYLRAIATSLLRTASRTSVDISDVVQETNLKAFTDFQTFQGSDEGVLVAWLRQILKNLVLNLVKNQGRPGRRPESLEALLERASEEAHWALASQGSSPSAQASRREQAVLTANALESLPSDYRQVLVWRCLENVPHKEIGSRMGRTEGASRELLARAAKALKKKLQEEP